MEDADFFRYATNEISGENGEWVVPLRERNA